MRRDQLEVLSWELANAAQESKDVLGRRRDTVSSRR